ncbi:MAG: hypothetical protein MH137_09535 [Flavobacteriales bacterium]|nr:hypothetical protein [Flavobacteriales bacterium]
MKNIIVREYLQSLTEKNELDYLFPILLEVMNFQIISTPKLTIGLPQYGKDIVATGTDKDGIKKRFYFEVKGGQDKDVTPSSFTKDDGIRMSLLEAKDKKFNDSSNPEFNNLPIKIILVHNGILNASVKDTFDDFIEREFTNSGKSGGTVYEFERWGIFELTALFSDYLFSEYLLTDDETVRLFKKVLVLIDTPKNNFSDYYQLINLIFDKAGKYESLSKRKRLLLFETLNIISYIIYSYCKESDNLENAKKCLPYSILKFWEWILENKIESDKKVLQHFQKHHNIYMKLLDEYFTKTIQVAALENGLWSPNGGRYEQVGYPIRTMEYLSYLVYFFEALGFQGIYDESLESQIKIDYLIAILNGNIQGTRPLLDNHSIPICLVLNYLIKNNREDDAKAFLGNLLGSIQVAYEAHKRLPDGANNLENVIQYVIKREKSISYVDSTSHLIGILFEYLALLGMKNEYYHYRDFVNNLKLDIAVFIPFDDEKLSTYLPNNTKSHEAHLFGHEIRKEGYQSHIILNDDFAMFQNRVFSSDEFTYKYRTDNVNLGYLKYLAHIFYKTPLFPNTWRCLNNSNRIFIIK